MSEWDEDLEEQRRIAETNMSFERWLEEHKSTLSRLDMPMVEDYILVVAFRGVESAEHGGFATLKTRGSPTYRIRGLLEIGLDFYSATPFSDPNAG